MAQVQWRAKANRAPFLQLFWSAAVCISRVMSIASCFFALVFLSNKRLQLLGLRQYKRVSSILVCCEKLYFESGVLEEFPELGCREFVRNF